MAERMRPEINCDNCTGACCSNVSLALSASEAEWFRASGTVLRIGLPHLPAVNITTIVNGRFIQTLDEHNWADEAEGFFKKAESEPTPEGREYWTRIAEHAATMRPGQGLYLMDGSCGNLKDGRCGDYANRATICREFKEGSDPCITIRKEEGVPLPSPKIRPSQT